MSNRVKLKLHKLNCTVLCTSNAQLSYYVYAFSSFITVVKLQYSEQKACRTVMCVAY